MSDREALAAALGPPEMFGTFTEGNVLIRRAARERLAQLPVPCTASNSRADCPSCHGKGFLYPAALVERIADLIALAIYNNSIDLVDQWTRDKSRSLTREILDALNTESL